MTVRSCQPNRNSLKLFFCVPPGFAYCSWAPPYTRHWAIQLKKLPEKILVLRTPLLRQKNSRVIISENDILKRQNYKFIDLRLLQLQIYSPPTSAFLNNVLVNKPNAPKHTAVHRCNISWSLDRQKRSRSKTKKWPDLTPFAFFLWTHLETKIYATQPKSVDYSRLRII